MSIVLMIAATGINDTVLFDVLIVKKIIDLSSCVIVTLGNSSAAIGT